MPPQRWHATGQGALGGHGPGAVQKALALLEAVAQLGPDATAKNVAAHTRIPPSTAYRLLNLLVADGYLVRVEDLSGFALGARIRELAGAAASAPDPAGSTSRILEELRAQVRFGIHLASFADGRVRLTDKDPDHELSGENLLITHLHASAIGKVLLAGRPEPPPDQPLRKLTPHTTVAPGALATELELIRRRALATELDECRIGRSAIAVPVHAFDGSLIGAVAAIGMTGRLAVTDREVIARLRNAAERLRSGTRPTPPTVPTGPTLTPPRSQ